MKRSPLLAYCIFLLIPGALMHLSINFTTTALGIADSAVLYSLTVAVLVIAAIVVCIVFGPDRLVRVPRRRKHGVTRDDTIEAALGTLS